MTMWHLFALRSVRGTGENSTLTLIFHRHFPLSARPPHLQVTKEDIQKLPRAQFKGECLLISDCSQEHKYADYIDKYLRQAKVLGMDTESKPAWTSCIRIVPALVQLSSEDVCVLWRLRGGHTKPQSYVFPPMLYEILTSKDILKVGHDVQNDAFQLINHYSVNTHNFFDTLRLSVSPRIKLPLLSLKGLTAMFLGQRLSKRSQMTNWERYELSKAQIDYATTDAWASLEVYKSLIQYASDQGVIPEPAVANTAQRLKIVQRERMLKNKKKIESGAVEEAFRNQPTVKLRELPQEGTAEAEEPLLTTSQ